MSNTSNAAKGACLSKCARANPEHFQEVTSTSMEKNFLLPCGCESVPLSALLDSHACSKCNVKYLYSFCLDEVVTEKSTWHCDFCGSCEY